MTATITTDFLSSVSKLTPMSPADYRRATLHADIYPTLQRWGFEDRYRYELPDWTEKRQLRAFKAMQAKLLGAGAIVALVGIRGTGKTTLAAQHAIGMAWQNYSDSIGEGVPGRLVLCKYTKATWLVGKFKGIYGDFGTIDGERLSDYRDYLCRNIEVLVIDELHETQDMKLRDRMLSDILDRRYAAKRDTILISNQTPEQFQESMPDSVISRLQEHGGVIPCSWKSFRDK